MKDLAKELRLQGLSYAAIAERLGVSRPTIQKWISPKYLDSYNRYQQKRAADPKVAAKRREYYRERYKILGTAAAEKKTNYVSKPHTVVTYFVKGVGTDLIKIGRTTNLPTRLSTLQTGSPVKLKLIGLAEVDEGEVKHLFRRDRVYGEWYKDSPRLRKFIREHLTEI